MYKLIAPLMLACAFVGCAPKEGPEPGEAGNGSTGSHSASPPVGTIAGAWKGIASPEELAHAREHGHPPSSDTLRIDADGTFALSSTSHGTTQTIEGDAKIEGTEVSLTPRMTNGVQAPQDMQTRPLTLRLTDSGKLADERGNPLFER